MAIDIQKIIDPSRVKYNEPMSEHTSFRVGGPAEIFVSPTEDELKELVRCAAEESVDLTIIGNGSNLLVSDRGLGGIVVSIGTNMSDITVDHPKDGTITAGAGALLSTLAKRALDSCLTGLEFASGIPGSVGGAVVMNAGAYGGEMKDVLVSANVLGSEGIKTIPAGELDLSYRHSRIMDIGGIVTSAVFRLKEGDPKQIAATMSDLNGRRRDKQPLNYPSAGSTFKRPEGYFAGKLIQDAGLKGFSVGGAQVSEKHSGFVVNTGGATAADVYRLIKHVQSVIMDKNGVFLETEVRLLGDFEGV